MLKNGSKPRQAHVVPQDNSKDWPWTIRYQCNTSERLGNNNNSSNTKSEAEPHKSEQHQARTEGDPHCPKQQCRRQSRIKNGLRNPITFAENSDAFPVKE